MKPIRTPESNTTYVLPGGNEDNFLAAEQLEEGVVKSVWTASPEERALIAGGARIVLLIWGSLVPPVALGLERPFCPGCKEPMTWIDELQRYQCDEHGDGPTPKENGGPPPE